MTVFTKMGSLALTLATALTLSLTLPTMSAVAKDATTAFQVKSTTNGKVRLGIRAFEKGDYEQSIRLYEAALATNMSPRKSAIVHSNICAAYGAMGKVQPAKASCKKALEIRPTYEPAQLNKAALVSLKK